MKKTIIIIILAIISLGLLAYIISGKTSSDTMKPTEAKEKIEKFINDNLLREGTTVELGEISEENGLYKIPITLPDGTELDSYMSKDGKFFFPEAMNIEEIENKLSNTPVDTNQSSASLQTEILTEGTGDQLVKNGDSITVDYTGVLEDGTEFDSSVGKIPFTFIIGQGQVIQGWDQGLIGMKVGEERRLVIPSDLAYGPNGTGGIPANSTLIFTVKLISIN